MKFSNKKQKRGLILSASFLVLSIAGIFYYRYLTAYDPGILPPLGKRIPFVHKKFKAEDGLTLHMPTGTHIVIPADALVDENGNKVKGNVTARFREFHTPGEILHSGIPMQFGEDRTDFFSSGGMMELRVSQNGKDLKVSEDKEVAVELASAITPDKDFKLYFLTDDLNWDNGAAFETVPNTRRDSALAVLPDPGIKPVDPVPGSDDIIFEITNTAGNKLTRAFKNTKWRLVDIPSGEDKEFAFSVNWTSVKITQPEEPNTPFVLTFSLKAVDYKGKIISRNCTVRATPLLTGEELEAAMEQFKNDLEAFEKEMADIELEKTRLLQEQGLLNRFQMDEFGICNIDKLKSTGILATVNITFDFEDELQPHINKVMLYMVLEEQNGVLKFNAFEWNALPIADTRFSLVAVLPDGKVAYVPSYKVEKQMEKQGTKKLFLETERYDYETFDKCMKNKSNPRFI
ncbi:MAG: hypothetical protein LW688_02970 [Cryomorphaceae bacterium]|jgi:hypothetical protein|nr:hypothetical protein [Cryomorphaceae bacterium]